MTQLLGDRVPPNLPAKFWPMCTRCGRRTSTVRWTTKAKTNLCAECRGEKPKTEEKP